MLRLTHTRGLILTLCDLSKTFVKMCLSGNSPIYEQMLFKELKQPTKGRHVSSLLTQQAKPKYGSGTPGFH